MEGIVKPVALAALLLACVGMASCGDNKLPQPAADLHERPKAATEQLSARPTHRFSEFGIEGDTARALDDMELLASRLGWPLTRETRGAKASASGPGDESVLELHWSAIEGDDQKDGVWVWATGPEPGDADAAAALAYAWLMLRGDYWLHRGVTAVQVDGIPYARLMEAVPTVLKSRGLQFDEEIAQAARFWKVRRGGAPLLAVELDEYPGDGTIRVVLQGGSAARGVAQSLIGEVVSAAARRRVELAEPSDN
jgi:hypothetical protein